MEKKKHSIHAIRKGNGNLQHPLCQILLYLTTGIYKGVSQAPGKIEERRAAVTEQESTEGEHGLSGMLAPAHTGLLQWQGKGIAG
jgi:hypothetical protein